MSNFHERFAPQTDQVPDDGAMMINNTINTFDDFGNHIENDNVGSADFFSSQSPQFPTYQPSPQHQQQYSPTKVSGRVIAMKPTAQDLQQQLQNIHLSPPRRHSTDSYFSPPYNAVHHIAETHVSPTRFGQEYYAPPLAPPDPYSSTQIPRLHVVQHEQQHFQQPNHHPYNPYPTMSTEHHLQHQQQHPTYFPESHLLQPHPFPYDPYSMSNGMDVYDESESFVHYEAPPIPPTLEFSRKPRKTDFNPYSLNDYKHLPRIERKQSLGVNRKRPDLVDKTQKRDFVRGYSRMVSAKNRQHKPKPKFIEPKSKSKTEKANEYAANLRAQHRTSLQTARSNPERPNHTRSKSLVLGREPKPKRRRMSVDVLDADLNKLKALHAQNRKAAQRMEL